MPGAILTRSLHSSCNNRGNRMCFRGKVHHQLQAGKRSLRPRVDAYPLARQAMSLLKPRHDGRLAQLVERFVYTEDVGGSNPSPPTNVISRSEMTAAVDPRDRREHAQRNDGGRQAL